LKFPEVKDGQLLRRPLYEVSDMSGDMTTATSVFGLYGDFRQGFLIVDRIGTTLEVLPGFSPTNLRPTAQRHAFMTFRTGSKVIVPEAIRRLTKS
jgi:HK97 family phage major capsid protein